MQDINKIIYSTYINETTLVYIYIYIYYMQEVRYQ